MTPNLDTPADYALFFHGSEWSANSGVRDLQALFDRAETRSDGMTTEELRAALFWWQRMMHWAAEDTTDGASLRTAHALCATIRARLDAGEVSPNRPF